MLLAMTIAPTLSLDMTNLEGWWGDTDSIREEQSVSQCDGSESEPTLMRWRPPPTSPVSRHSDGIQPAVSQQSMHVCQEGLSVYSTLLGAQPQAPQLVALKPQGWSDEEAPCECWPNAWKINVTHFFPSIREHDNEVHGNSSSLTIKAGVTMAPSWWTLHFRTHFHGFYYSHMDINGVNECSVQNAMQPQHSVVF